MDTQDNRTIEIPTGKSKEDFKIRKQIIWQFYQDWKKKLLWMRYNLLGVGEVKLMVGIVKRTKDKVQYCITVIQT